MSFESISVDIGGIKLGWGISTQDGHGEDGISSIDLFLKYLSIICKILKKTKHLKKTIK